MGKRFRILGPIIVLFVVGLCSVNEGLAFTIKKHGKHAFRTAISKKNGTVKPLAKQNLPARMSGKAIPTKRMVFRHKKRSPRIAASRHARYRRIKLVRLVPHRRVYSTRPIAAFKTEPEIGPAGERDKLNFRIVETAYDGLGLPYRYGGTTTNGFDCSGFVQHVFNENGIKLARTSCDQARAGVRVPLSALKPGDLIFFSMHRRKRRQIDHVGLYVGGGRFIHAASSRSGCVKISRLKSRPYRNRVVTARRVTDLLN